MGLKEEDGGAGGKSPFVILHSQQNVAEVMLCDLPG